MSSREYGADYFSRKNVAYAVDGYDLESRRRKYADVVENIVKHCPQPWLDAGCGPGYLVHILRERGYAAYGCDFSELAMEMSTIASRPFLNRCDVTNMPYFENEFASSSAFHVLEHLTETGAEKAVNELFRVTKQRFYGIIPTTDGIIERDLTIKKQILEDPLHLTIRPRTWWINLFQEYDFRENVELEEIFDKKQYGWVFVFDK